MLLFLDVFTAFLESSSLFIDKDYLNICITLFIILLLLLVQVIFASFSQGLSIFIFLLQKYCLEIFTYLSESDFITCLSHSFLLSIHSLIACRFSNLLVSYSVSCFATVFLSTFITFVSNIYLVFKVIALIYGSIPIWEYMYLFIQIKSFSQPATLY